MLHRETSKFNSTSILNAKLGQPQPLLTTTMSSSIAESSKKVASTNTPKPIPDFPSSFSKSQAKKAVDALLEHQKADRLKKEDTVLIAKDEHVWLIVNTKSGPKNRSLKPKRM